MSLQSLVLCSDEKILRVLRRVLNELEIGADYCSEADEAVRKLTRDRFEAVIVDCVDTGMAAAVLGSARSAPCNKRAVAVAIVEPTASLRTAFDLGAHFVLYQPLSAERAKNSFRAARALMKRERRRNARVAVEIPVTLRMPESGQLRASTSDLGEGGMAVKLPHRPQNLTSISLYFQLPGTHHSVECFGEMAWEGTGRHVGIRFVDLSPDTREQLKGWLEKHSPDFEKDDPPVLCKLVNLSPAACYLELTAPFPVPTRVILSIRVGGLQIQAEGVVRIMHPEAGMGVEFSRSTAKEQEHVEKFIAALRENPEAPQNLLVEPEGLEVAENATQRPAETKDPLLHLFRSKAELAPEAFQAELRKHRAKSRSAASH
ncbi:MAG TPA: PilZ domain-containing protein [Terriglobales bacterium]|nr:PilZ domain-containing protein [Terriglobales bacterium]